MTSSVEELRLPLFVPALVCSMVSSAHEKQSDSTRKVQFWLHGINNKTCEEDLLIFL